MSIFRFFLLASMVLLSMSLSPRLLASTEIVLENYFRDLKSVKVTINGNEFTFLFDTGGGLTMVSPQIIQTLNKTAYGNSVGYRMSGEKVDTLKADDVTLHLGGMAFHHDVVGVFDIMKLLPESFERIDGLISLKTFEHHNLRLSLQKNRVFVDNDEDFARHTKGRLPVPSRFANGLNGEELNIFLGVQQRQRMWWFLFDSGNITAVKISPVTADAWDIAPDMETSYALNVADTVLKAPVSIESIIYDGALSFSAIKQRDYFISFKRRKVWVAE